MKKILHWYEGQFLQPHHFQQEQQSLEATFVQERSFATPYPYGVADFSILTDHLEDGWVRFDNLKLVFPDGLFVDTRHNASLPPLNIKDALSKRTSHLDIYVGIPILHFNRANTLEDSGSGSTMAKYRYIIESSEVCDENTGDNPKPVVRRLINCRLLLDGDDTSDLEIFHLLRVKMSAGENVGKPRLDPDFCPASINIGASVQLLKLLQELAAQINASKSELGVQLSRGGFDMEKLRGLQIEQLLRFRTLSRYSASFFSLTSCLSIHPYSAYLMLVEMLGELCALQPDRSDIDIPPYRHDAQMEVFAELSRKLRSFLKGAVAATYMKVDFTKGNECFEASFKSEHFANPNDYLLGIETREDPRVLAALVEDADQFKFMSKSAAFRPIRGLKLKEERHVPLELPANTGLHYFRVLRGESGRMWELFTSEKEASIRWPSISTSDFKITLYMTVPTGK